MESRLTKMVQIRGGDQSVRTQHEQFHELLNFISAKYHSKNFTSPNDDDTWRSPRADDWEGISCAAKRWNRSVNARRPRRAALHAREPASTSAEASHPHRSTRPQPHGKREQAGGNPGRIASTGKRHFRADRQRIRREPEAIASRSNRHRRRQADSGQVPVSRRGLARRRGHAGARDLAAQGW